jgi:SAM-dependent methyltransferase
VVRPETRADRELRRRYTVADLRVLTAEETTRFVRHGADDPQADPALAWELLYRLEPDLYDRLATAERLHPAILGWLPRGVDTIVEVGAGTGRLTIQLIDRGRRVVAVEPALPLRRILQRKLAAADTDRRVTVVPGFFDHLPVPPDVADLVIACSAFTSSAAHGGDAGLSEMERVCRAGGCVVIVWPNDVEWLVSRGYRYVSFDGPMSVQFASHEEAVELAEVFYPSAVRAIREGGLLRVPFEVLGFNPPRDLAYKTLSR